MTKLEAAALVAMLSAAFPGLRFTEENSAAYEDGIIDLGAAESQMAARELVKSSPRMPSVAEFRAEVYRLRRHEHQLATSARLQLTSGDGESLGPSPQAWGECLSRQLHAATKHREMADRWYAAHGMKTPPDPAQAIVNMVTAAARGEDVRSRFARTVLPDESEVRYP